MSKKRLGRVLTILILAAFAVEEIGMDVNAYIPETVSTGTQTDAIIEAADNKEKNASKYEKINSDEDGSSDEKLPDSDEDEEIEIVWEDVHLKTEDDLIDFAKKCRLDTYSANKKVYLDADIVMTNLDFEGIPYFN